MSKKYQALIVDDHPVFCTGLRNVLNKMNLFTKVHIVHDGIKAVEFFNHTNIDLVFLDIEMPHLGGVPTALTMKRQQPDIKIIIISMFCEPTSVAQLLKHGINGYLMKDATFQEIAICARKVLEGETNYCKKVLDVLHSINTNNEIEQNNPFKLTKNQILILKLIDEGKRTKQIAEILNLSLNTIKRYRDQIHKKMNCNTSVEMINIARKNGIC